MVSRGNVGSPVSIHRLSRGAFIRIKTKKNAPRDQEFLIAVPTGLSYEYSNKHWFITIFRFNLSTGTNLKAGI
jgi:hypothetical protein